jgi:hypothetical protein
VNGFCGFLSVAKFTVKIPEIGFFGEFFTSFAFNVFADIVFNGFDKTRIFNFWMRELNGFFHMGFPVYESDLKHKFFGKKRGEGKSKLWFLVSCSNHCTQIRFMISNSKRFEILSSPDFKLSLLALLFVRFLGSQWELFLSVLPKGALSPSSGGGG